MKKWKIIVLMGLLLAVAGIVSCISSPADAAKSNNDDNKRLEELAASLRLELADQINEENIIIYRYENVLVVSMNEKFLFDGDSATLKDSMTQRLLRIAEILKQAPDKVIRIVGHTAVWESKKWVSSWDLGAQRAVNIVRFLQEKGGIDPKKLVAATMGEYQPIASNANEVGRQKNRRVEIILMDPELFDTKKMDVMKE